MAVINYRGVFPALNNSTRITIALPDINPEEGAKWPVLWLLGEEGMSSNYYVRKCDIESLCRKYDIAIVMPEGLHSDYENMVRGLRWYDFVHQLHVVAENFVVDDVSLGEHHTVFLHGVGIHGLLYSLCGGSGRYALLCTAVAAKTAAVGELIATIHAKCHKHIPPSLKY